MAAQTTAEKMDRIERAWHENQDDKLIYEWVKTGNLSLAEFKAALDLIAFLQENELRKILG